MLRFVSRSFLPVVLLTAACLANAQDVKEDWQKWYSEKLGVLFLAYGKPVEEVVEFSGPLADLVGKPIGVGFDKDDAEFSILRVAFKPGKGTTPREVVGMRLALPKSKAPDFKLKEEHESSDSDYPCYQAWAEYTGPEGDFVSERTTVIVHGADLWIVEASGLTTMAARESANRFLDSIRMDPEGKTKPGAPKKS